MSIRLFIPILAAVILVPALSQVPTSPPKRPRQPVFSPPEAGGQDAQPDSKPARPDRKPPTPTPAVDAPQPQIPADPIDALFARLARWPDKSSREAAVALSGLGSEVETRLIQALGHNDWRVQAGAAHALGEMGSKAAVKPLAGAIRDPSNGAALSVLLSAIVKIDPQNGPKEVLPFLSNSAGRVREAALKAMPNPLDARYAEDAALMFQSRSPAVRATAINLLSRIPEASGREEFFQALADPEVTVANPAARHLASFGDEAALKRLVTLAREGALRQVSYALLALTMAEDARGIVLVPDSDPVRERAYQMLQGEDGFHRAAAAIFLSNLSFRADDGTLRAIADRYLVPILLDAVAGGNFFNDYVAVEELVYRKLELLSGEALGPSSLKWKAWWLRTADSFHARHQLRALGAAELAQCTVSVRVEEPGGRIRSAIFVGDSNQATASMAGTAFVLGPREREVLKSAFDSSRFFLGRSDLEAGARARALTEITVQCGADRFTRRHGGEPPADILPLVNTLFDVARSLSWQQFAPIEPAARASYIREQTEFFKTATAEQQRERLTTLAVYGYPSFSREGKKAAIEILLVSSPEFRSRNATQLLQLLRSEPMLDDNAAALIGVLSTVDAVPVRDQVLAFLGKSPGQRAGDVVRDFLSRQPRTNVIAALRSESAVTRVAAAESLARFKGDKDVVSILIESIADFDPRVREAAIKTLATFEDERIPAMLDAALSGQDKALRIRAIEALGAVQKGAAVARLTEVFRNGDVHERFAVIRSLGAIPEKRATIALGSIVRECPDMQMAGEALAVLGRSSDENAPAEVAEIFRKTRVPDLKLQAMDALASLKGEDAIPDLLPALDSEDADLRRVALLTLARLGARETLPRLMETLKKPEGDPAAEAAFSRLTFFVSEHKAPAHRFLEYQRFVDEAGSLSRDEWFVRALRAVKADPAVLEGFDPDKPLDGPRFGLLIRVVSDGNWALRADAEARLIEATGMKMTPLGRIASPEEIQERVVTYRRWLETNPDGLLRKKLPKPAPASRAAESAPAESRPESR